MGGEGIGSVVRRSLAQCDMAAKLAEAARWKDECIERGGGRFVRAVIEVKARVCRLAEHQRCPRRIPRSRQRRAFEQHPVCDRGPSGVLLDLAAQVEELGVEPVVGARRGCAVDEPPGESDVPRQPGLAPRERQTAGLIHLRGRESCRCLICGRRG